MDKHKFVLMCTTNAFSVQSAPLIAAVSCAVSRAELAMSMFGEPGCGDTVAWAWHCRDPVAWVNVMLLLHTAIRCYTNQCYTMTATDTRVRRCVGYTRLTTDPRVHILSTTAAVVMVTAPARHGG